MTRRPFDDIRDALSHGSDAEQGFVRLDPHREARTGVPEIVYAGVKPAAEVARSLSRLAEANGRAMATRCTSEQMIAVQSELGDRYEVTLHDAARSIVVAKPGHPRPVRGGRVGVITAGSSDRPVAAEAALVASELGAAVSEAYDMGVAGLHRLVSPLEAMVADGVDVIVVAAGMDGALPSVVAGLVAVPVIGVPTSTGYGYGGTGTGALMTMLQTCAPGVVVVNIDNGVGAGATAALIANRAAEGRRG